MTETVRKKILVVDDNPIFLELIKVAFSAEFEILTAPDGREGVALANKERPALILLDVMMPKVSGVEMLRELQTDGDTRAIPIMILTASALNDSTLEMLKREGNVVDVLRKPCGIEKLRMQIRAAFAKKD